MEETKNKNTTFKKAINYLIFGNYIKLRNKTQYIAYIAVLTALAIVLNFSVNFGPGGEAKLTLMYIPLFLTGIYFGPLVAAVVGASSKLLGALLFTPQYGIPWTSNIIAAALMGVIMCLCVQLIRNIRVPYRIVIGAAIVCLTVTLGLNTAAFMYEPGSAYAEWTYWQILFFTVPPRILIQPLILAFNTVLTILLMGPLDAYFKGKGGEYINKVKQDKN